MKRFVIAFLFLLLSSLAPVQAQEMIGPIFEKQEKVIDITKINKSLTKMEKAISATTGVKKEDTVQYIKDISLYHTDLQTLKSRTNDTITGIHKKLSALGPVPENPDEEPQEIKKQRSIFNKELDTAKSQIAKADLALTKIDELNQRILKMRNQELMNSILVKQKSILNIKEAFHALSNFSIFLYQLCIYPFQWYHGLTEQQHTQVQNVLIGLAFWAVLALICAIFLNCYLRRKFGYDMSIKKPTYPQKVQAALFMILARGLIPSAIPAAFLIWHLGYEGFFPGQISIVLTTACYYLLYLFLFTAIVSVLFTPKKTQWRLLEVTDEKAISLTNALFLSSLIFCFASFLHVTAIRLDSDLDTIYALKLLTNVVKAFCIILVSRRLLYTNTALTEEQLNNGDIQELTTSSKLSFLLGFATLVVLSFSLAGYLRLTEFIYNRFLVSISFAGLCYIFRKLLLVLFHQLMDRKFWMRQLRINKQQTSKIELWFNFLLTPLIFMFATITILGIWGVSVDIMLQSIKKFLVGFDIGDMHVSIVSIFLGTMAFLVTLFITRHIKNSLTTGKLSQIDMDPGVRNSMAALSGFIGTVMAVLLGISVMGGSLKGLAIAAGALSFGAGLGMQNIVSNFVSGLILLFERPIKIGDWVIINGYEGIIKQISLRSTQLETFNRANVIIPNADLLSNSLVNMTYKGRIARIDIPIGVGYDSDVLKVQEVLLEIAKATKHVAQSPQPFVLFKELGDSSLNFQLSCYTTDITHKFNIQTEILVQVIERFREENIEIPFPQRVLHIAQNMPLPLPSEDIETATDETK